MCALCVVVVPIKVMAQRQRARLAAPKPLRAIQQHRILDACNMGFKCLVEPRYCMDTTNMDARISSTTTSCSGTSAASTAKQCYSATIVPDAPVSGPTPNEYDDAIGAEQQRAQSSHAAEADGSDASHRIEQGLRRLGGWLMLLNAIKSYMC